MNFYCIIFGVLFAAFSVAFFLGKQPKFLNLWVKTTSQESSEINIQALYKNVSLVLFLAAFLFIVSGFFQGFLDQYFIWGILAWFVLTGLDVLYISKSKKFITKN